MWEIADSVLTSRDNVFTLPGQCSSLRAQVDGRDIYPVYKDFRNDLQALCAAKQQYGGNARTLNTQGWLL